MAGFSSPDWDSVPDIHADGRTVLAYPDPNPEFIAGVWDRHRAGRSDKASAKEVDPDEDPDAHSAYKDYHPPVITAEAEEFDDPCSALATWVKRAVEGGWELIELAHAQSLSEGKPYASGAKAGEIRPPREVDLQWIKVEKEGVGRALIVYPVVNGKVLGTRVTRRFNGAHYGDADMQKILKGEYGNADID